MVYYIVSVLFFWCPCMAINNVSERYNGELLPDIILLTQCYFHRGTRSNATKRFCICSLWSHLTFWHFPPSNWGMLRRSRCVLIFLWITVGFSPVLYCWPPMLLPSGNPFKYHEEVSYLQTMIPPERFDIFPPDWGMLIGSRCVQIFLQMHRKSYPTYMHRQRSI